jgi:hypothetical protein
VLGVCERRARGTTNLEIAARRPTRVAHEARLNIPSSARRDSTEVEGATRFLAVESRRLTFRGGAKQTSAERAEALVSLATEVSVLQTELAALTAPVVSANSVVAAETLKAKMKMFDWKKLNPIAWLKNKLGLSKGTLAMGGEELPLQVNAPYGVEATPATPAAPRKLLASER